MTRRRITLLVAGTLVVFIALATWGWFASANIREFLGDLWTRKALYDRPFERYVQELRNAGEVVDIDELLGPMPPDEENAAPEFAAAWAALVETEGAADQWPAQSLWETSGDSEGDDAVAESPDLHAQMEQFLERGRPYFERIAAALDRPYLRLPRTFDGDGWPNEVLTSKLHDTVRLLDKRAHFALDAKDRLAAIRDLLRIGRTLETSDVIGHLVAAHSTAAATIALRRGIERGEIDTDQASAQLAGLLKSSWHSKLRNVLLSQRAEVVWMHRALADGRLSGEIEDLSKGNLESGRIDFNFVAPCDVVTRVLGWHSIPYGEWRSRFDALLEDSGARNDTIKIVVTKSAEQLCRADAATRLARVALAAAEHRAKHGHFPVSLDELKAVFPDGVPLDPYTEAGFEYERTGSGVRVASAGRLSSESPLEEAELRKRGLVWELRR